MVPQEMRDILAQPGFLSIKNGAQKLKKLYAIHSSHFNPGLITAFGLACYLGDLDSVQKDIQAGIAPELSGWETPFQLSYPTLVVEGASALKRGTHEGPNPQHVEVLKLLLSSGAPPDIPDIVGLTALHHATMDANVPAELARVLLENGANVNHRDRYGAVPLQGASHSNHVAAVDVLMEFGADVNISDTDGVVPYEFALQCGPQVTAVVQKWLRKREGVEAPMEEKRCDNCKADASGKGVKLKMCSACHTSWYCSSQCQRQHWKTHKPHCRPFSKSNTVTLIPSYSNHGHMAPMADLMRAFTGVSPTVPEFTPTLPAKPKLSSKSMIVKVQVPWSPGSQRSVAPILIYNKKQDFKCSVLRSSDPAAYDRIQDVVRKRGVGGAKAYLMAELENPGKLVVKVDEILAEQPF